jgi:hypothetical protein
MVCLDSTALGGGEADAEEAGMPAARRTYWGPLLYSLAAGLALTSAGCLLAIAGLATGGAATGYLYCKGRIYRDFNAGLPEVYNAVRASLLDLQFPLFREESKDGKAFFVTKTTNGKKVRIYLESLSSPIPAERLLTRVSIRVATFGDEGISARIFDQIAFHVAHPTLLAPAPAAPPEGAPPPIQQTSAVKPAFETNPPPMAKQP